MKKYLLSVLLPMLLISSVVAQGADRAAPFLGDWQDKTGTYFAQVYIAKDGIYNANLTKDLTSRTAPVAVLLGEMEIKDVLTFSGDGWKGKLEDGKFVISKEAESIEMHPIYRTSPTNNAPPPNGAIVLFDGTNLDAWNRPTGANHHMLWETLTHGEIGAIGLIGIRHE